MRYLQTVLLCCVNDKFSFIKSWIYIVIWKGWLSVSFSANGQLICLSHVDYQIICVTVLMCHAGHLDEDIANLLWTFLKRGASVVYIHKCITFISVCACRLWTRWTKQGQEQTGLMSTGWKLLHFQRIWTLF